MSHKKNKFVNKFFQERVMKISFTVLCYLIMRVVKAHASIFSDVYFHETKARHAKLVPHPS